MLITIVELGIYEVGIMVVGLIGSLQQSILVVLFYDYDIVYVYMVTSAHTFLTHIIYYIYIYNSMQSASGRQCIEIVTIFFCKFINLNNSWKVKLCMNACFIHSAGKIYDY